MNWFWMAAATGCGVVPTTQGATNAATVFSAMVDAFGWFGFERHDAGLGRLAPPLMMLARVLAGQTCSSGRDAR